MKNDRTIKCCLIIIVVFLGFIAMKPLIVDTVLASPESSYNFVQVWSGAWFSTAAQSYFGLPMQNHVLLFDTRNGSIWAYSITALAGKAEPVYIGRLNKIGETIVK